MVVCFALLGNQVLVATSGASTQNYALAARSKVEKIGNELDKIHYRFSHPREGSVEVTRQFYHRVQGGRYAEFILSKNGIQHFYFPEKMREGFEPLTRNEMEKSILERLSRMQRALLELVPDALDSPIKIFVVPSRSRPDAIMHPHLLALHHQKDYWYVTLIYPKFSEAGHGQRLNTLSMTIDLLMNEKVAPESMARFIASMRRLTSRDHRRKPTVSPDIDAVIKGDVVRFIESHAKAKQKAEQELAIKRAALKRAHLSPEERARRFRYSLAAVAIISGIFSLTPWFVVINQYAWSKVLMYACYSVLTNVLALYSTGQENRLRTLFWSEIARFTALGMLQGIITVGGFGIIGWLLSDDAPLHWLHIAAGRPISAAYLTYRRDRLFLAFEKWMMKKIQDPETFERKSKSRDEKYDEAWWSVRTIGWGRQLPIQLLIPEQYRVAAETVISRMLNLFYQWGANKKGFLVAEQYRNPRWLYLPWYWYYHFGNRLLYLPSVAVVLFVRAVIVQGIDAVTLPFRLLAKSAWENMAQLRDRFRARRLSDDLGSPPLLPSEKSA